MPAIVATVTKKNVKRLIMVPPINMLRRTEINSPNYFVLKPVSMIFRSPSYTDLTPVHIVLCTASRAVPLSRAH